MEVQTEAAHSSKLAPCRHTIFKVTMNLYKLPTAGMFAIECLLFVQGLHTADATTIAMFVGTAIDRVMALVD